MEKRRSGSRITVAAATVAGLAMCWSALVAQQDPSAQVPVFRSGVEAVAVDVGVIDRQGAPLRGLTAADFKVSVAGQPRRVISADRSTNDRFSKNREAARATCRTLPGSSVP